MDWIKEFLRPELIWFLVGLVLLIMEFMLPGLIVFFFGVGAWIVAIVCLLSSYIHSSINAQLLLFIISSVLSLLILRRWVKGVFLGHSGAKQDLREDLKEFIGERATVIEDISPKAGGKVEFHGTNWEARADGDIAAGAVVEIIGKDNITLKVREI
jgi:membrane protein implicated in regulation of membrane protease activity